MTTSELISINPLEDYTMSELTPELKAEQYPPAPSAEDVQWAMRILAQLGKPAPLAAGQQRVPGSEFDLATILQDHNQRLKVLEAMPDKVKYAPGWSAEVNNRFIAGVSKGWGKKDDIHVSYRQGEPCAVVTLVGTEDNEILLTLGMLMKHIGGCLEAAARMEAGDADV